MKKKIIIIAVILLVLAAAVKFRVALAYVLLGGETLQLDRSEISSVQGTSVTSVPVKTAKLSESQIDSFIELLNSLELKKIPFRNEKKDGWLYGFSAFKEDGSFVSISFLDNGMVTIDGNVYVTLRSGSDSLEGYF
jgi:hypothetical protein